MTGTFTPFLQMLQNRRLEASRSVLVQVQSAQSYKQLFTYCEPMGKVKRMFHYTEGPEPMVMAVSLANMFVLEPLFIVALYNC